MVKKATACFRYVVWNWSFHQTLLLDLKLRRLVWYSDSEYVSGKSHWVSPAALRYVPMMNDENFCLICIWYSDSEYVSGKKPLSFACCVEVPMMNDENFCLICIWYSDSEYVSGKSHWVLPAALRYQWWMMRISVLSAFDTLTHNMCREKAIEFCLLRWGTNDEWWEFLSYLHLYSFNLLFFIQRIDTSCRQSLSWFRVRQVCHLYKVDDPGCDSG